MDIELALKIIGVIFTIITAGRVIYQIKMDQKHKLREEYRFSKEFLGDLQSEDIKHPFVLEKGYQAIAGTTNITGKEVEYILTLVDSNVCLRNYVFSRRYLQHLDASGDLKIDFVDKFKSSLRRKIKKGMYLFLYVVFAFGLLYPLAFGVFFGLQLKNILILLAIFLPVMGYYAWVSLISYIEIVRAEKLVKSQKKHTQRIVIKNSIF